MAQTAVPMIHVPDVRATVAWYTSIGFTLVRQNEEDGEINWAKLTFGNSEVMFDAGGKTSTEHRREVDLYILTDNVDDLHRRLKERVQVVENLYNAFYGMREFVVRDCNGFWITFGQPIQP
ncbi:MAG TPA: VOC family protein [Candidatus Acidoferrum sp.]|nr:VOC family protein [Candidatus Acidoferrum sp.]